MKSKTSFFSPEVFTGNIKRYWPLWALVSFFGSLVPLSLLLDVARGDELNSAKMADYYFEFFYGPGQVITFIFAIIAAECVWNYLYSHRSVSMYHSMPVTRKALFITSFASGLAIMLIPFVIGGALTVLVSAIFGCSAMKAAFTISLGILLESFIFFSIATLLAHTVGNIVALTIVYFLVNFILTFGEVLCEEILRGFLFGYSGYYAGYLEFLSPIMFFFKKMDCIYTPYEEGPDFTINYATGIRNMYIIWIYAGVALLLSFAAYFLYKNRKSETAGAVAAFGWVKRIFHAVFAIIGALCMGLVFSEILGIGSPSDYRNPVAFGFCLVLSGIISYFVGHMIIERTVRVFSKKKFIGAGIYSVIYIVFVVLSASDVFGIQYYQPAKEETVSAVLMLDGAEITISPENDPELYDKLLEFQRGVVDDREIYRLRYWPVECDEYLFFSIDFETKNGRKIERTYDIGFFDDELDDSSSGPSKVKEFLASYELADRFISEKPDFRSAYTTVSIYSSKNDFCEMTEKEGTDIIVSGLRKDLEEGKWDLYMNTMRKYGEKTGLVEVQYENPNEEVKDEFWRNIYWNSFVLTEDMNNTIEALEKAGISTEEEIRECLEYSGTEEYVTYEK